MFGVAFPKASAVPPVRCIAFRHDVPLPVIFAAMIIGRMFPGTGPSSTAMRSMTDRRQPFISATAKGRDL